MLPTTLDKHCIMALSRTNHKSYIIHCNANNKRRYASYPAFCVVSQQRRRRRWRSGAMTQPLVFCRAFYWRPRAKLLSMRSRLYRSLRLTSVTSRFFVAIKGVPRVKVKTEPMITRFSVSLKTASTDLPFENSVPSSSDGNRAEGCGSLFARSP